MKNEDLKTEVTNKLIELMEEHGTDWVKPWANASGGLPINLVSKNAYQGINTLVLAMQMRQSQTWATYKQWMEKGHQVNRGEKGTHVIFYKALKRKDTQGDEFFIPMLKNYTVFNSAQVEGWEEPEKIVLPPVERNELVDKYIETTGAVIKYDGAEAFYSPMEDYISMPDRNTWIGTDTSTPEECYYSTALHELTHWTGHKTRLDRHTKGKSQTEYAKEELIAELGSAFQCMTLGISATPRPDHAKYLNSWLSALKNDKDLIFKAAAAASKAVGFIEELQETTRGH
jgi:antirestriction protein ArdC